MITVATVKSPVKDFSGVVAGVTFTDGVASTTNKNALAYFKRHGYTVQTAAEAKAEAKAEATTDPDPNGEGDPQADA